jgi:hypothetical protein
VLSIATAASPLASSAEPALNPNQPTHSSPAPTMVSASECGGIASFKWPIRGPAKAHADQPGDAGVDVDHRAAGEIDRAGLEQQALAAHTICASGA